MVVSTSRRWRLAAVVAVAIVAALPARAAPLPKEGTVLEDQFGAKTDVGPALFAGHVVIVVSNEREAATSLAAWRRAIGNLLPAGARLLLVADLRSLPFFVPRSAVAAGLRKDHPGMPIHLDWKGALAAALDPGKAGVLAACWRDGCCTAQVTGMPDEAALQRLVR